MVPGVMEVSLGMFSVLYGGLWLGEGHLLARLTGAGYIGAGVILITGWGN
jgi:hypothetical protein